MRASFRQSALRTSPAILAGICAAACTRALTEYPELPISRFCSTRLRQVLRKRLFWICNNLMEKITARSEGGSLMEWPVGKRKQAREVSSVTKRKTASVFGRNYYTELKGEPTMKSSMKALAVLTPLHIAL